MPRESAPHQTVVNLADDLNALAIEVPLTIPVPGGPVVVHVVTRPGELEPPAAGGAQ